MLRYLCALLFALFAGPALAGAGEVKLADVRLLDGAAPFVAAFLARTDLRYEPDPPRLDRHGRRLAHVFSGSLWLQEELVARGLAIAAPPLVSRERALALLRLERRARLSEPGLWARTDARPIPADRARTALDRFAVVEGRVLSVARGFRSNFVNFGEDWREDFTIYLKRGRIARAFPPETLEGQRIRVRGWVYYSNGPAIDLADPIYLEMLGRQDGDHPASPWR